MDDAVLPCMLHGVGEVQDELGSPARRGRALGRLLETTATGQLAHERAVHEPHGLSPFGDGR
jgi:hypothetical protein